MSTIEIVDDLIDSSIRSWLVSLIDQMFLPHEAKVIKSIPLCERAGQDTQAWTYTSMGQFSVKSAYKNIRTQQLSSSHGQSLDHLQRNRI